MVLDSVSPEGIRLVTMELTYPLIVHNEFLTHRAIGRSDEQQYDQWLEFSRNASSNRAIPSSKIVQQVLDDPFVPLNFRRATKGMIAGEALTEVDQQWARDEWLRARDDAVARVRNFENHDPQIHKQWRNRLLGPFQWITVVATANGEMWEHFFNLRDHKAAQDEIHFIADMAHSIYRNHKPTPLMLSEWHLPYVSSPRDGLLFEELLPQSVARCARASNLRQGEKVDIRDDFKLFEDLIESNPPHASPTEHQAMATYKNVRSGNLVGFKQYRKKLGL